MSIYLDASIIPPPQIKEAGGVMVDCFMADVDGDLILGGVAPVKAASARSRLVRTGLLDHEDASRSDPQTRAR